MKLSIKVLLILSVIFITVFFTVYFNSSYNISKHYQKLEEQSLLEKVHLTQTTIDSWLQPVKTLTADWSAWDDAWKFMQTHDPKFIESNLAFTTFENGKINLIAFFDKNQKIFSIHYYDLIQHRFTKPPEALTNYFNQHSSLIKQGHNKSLSGFLSFDQQYWAFSLAPILTSTGQPPSQGTILMGYIIPQNAFAKLNQQTKITVNLIKDTNSSSSNTSPSIWQDLQKKSILFIPNHLIMDTYILIRDINNNPMAMVHLPVYRAAYAEGQRNIHYFLTAIVALSALVLFMIWYLLKFLILNRISYIRKTVKEIEKTCDFSKRLPIQSRDEISELSNSINSFIEIIELTQNQLKHRIVSRNEELSRLSELNKNLKLEIDQQKTLQMQIQKEEESYKYQALHDSLTGLPNRSYYEKICEGLLQDKTPPIKASEYFALLFLDTDKFKQINDTYGHEAGDTFLRHVAERLRNQLSKRDFVARLSGDEFIIIINHDNHKTYVNKIIERILQFISYPISIENREVTLKAHFSVGISLFPQDGLTLPELERKADLAMYHAKKQKGNSYCYYEDIAHFAGDDFLKMNQ